MYWNLDCSLKINIYIKLNKLTNISLFIYLLIIFFGSYQAPDAKDVTWAGAAGPSSRKRQTSSKNRQDAIKDVKTAASKPRRFREKGESRKAGNKKTKAENSLSKT